MYIYFFRLNKNFLSPIYQNKIKVKNQIIFVYFFLVMVEVMLDGRFSFVVVHELFLLSVSFSILNYQLNDKQQNLIKQKTKLNRISLILIKLTNKSNNNNSWNDNEVIIIAACVTRSF